ncbi:uncharacterized protein LOC143175141 [Nomia melanderi]|uniref:uncharacterized protein LOC143175141 n=1 Tax=Nomia melanderi TaxID=2448451 RepID=UPI003FCD2BAF
MQWHFGGNLEPVHMICEVDWKECPKAIANYIWSEIVTDVLDYLTEKLVLQALNVIFICLVKTNITLMILVHPESDDQTSSVLCTFLVCTLLFRVIQSKGKRLNNVLKDKEILNKVGYKIEDLELKVNILTYKMQYGSWPMPHEIQKPKFRKHLQNLRLTLSNANDRADWIKQVLLRPGRDESFISYSKGKHHPSEHHLTELFDAKKNSFYRCPRREVLPLEPINRSSKSDSDRSLKMNPVFKRVGNRRRRKASKSENFEVQNKNVSSHPLPQQKGNSRSTSRLGHKAKLLKAEKMMEPFKKYTRSMDECKQFLQELHESNKNLGLVCSSQEISNESSVNNCWSDVQQQKYIQQKDTPSVSEKSRENSVDTNKITMKQKKDMKAKVPRKQNKENCLDISNAVCPIIKLTDKRLVPSKMNITFCNEMFPQQSSHTFIPQLCERQKYIETSQETLYQVKKKLESLHNVIRTYEIQNSEARVKDKSQDSGNKLNNIYQNVMDKTISIKTEANARDKKGKNRVGFNTATRKGFNDIHKTVYISSEQYDSDETGRSSDISIQSYSHVVSTYYTNNLNDLYSSLPKQTENQMYLLSNQKSNKIPERVYYTISSDFVDDKNSSTETIAKDNYVIPNETKPFSYSEGQIVPMETDEDLITSPTSSRTEISKESESDDKSTALLLQEALQIKRALLTRVELEKTCYNDEKRENISNKCISEYSKCSYINNNLQTKLLDIITEEQSVSSSTERSSRTYMFFNIKHGKQLPNSSGFSENVRDFIHKNQIMNQDTRRDGTDSNQNLASGSEYFSLSNIIQENDKANINELSLSKYKSVHETKSTESVSCNLHIKHESNTSNKSDEKLKEIEFTNYLRNVHTEEKPKSNFLCISNMNELVTHNNSSMELFSENLNDSFIDEQNLNLNKNEGCNLLDSDSVDHCKIVDDLLNKNLNVLEDKKYIEDNENLISSPNLSLKRHPGTCSLIEQIIATENAEETTEFHTLIDDAGTMYELSISESKENSIETNLQDSCSINYSNNSNIPEQSSITELANKSADEELNLNWSTVKNDYSDDYVNVKNEQTISTNTITIQKCDFVEVENCDEQGPTCKEELSSTERRKAPQVRYVEDGKNSSVAQNSVVNLDNKEIINEADLYKSYSNLISPQSSVYFTDEASSSTTKLNNSNPKHTKDCVYSTLKAQQTNTKLDYHEQDLKDTRNTDLLFISKSNDHKMVNLAETKIAKSYVKITINNDDETTKLLDFDRESNKNNVTVSENHIKNINASTINNIEATIKDEITLENQTSIPYNNMNNQISLPTSMSPSDKEQLNSHVNETKIITDQTAILSGTSSCQVSPRDLNENITLQRTNTKIKSKSYEISKFETLKKSVALQSLKSLKSDSANTVHTRTDYNTPSIQTKFRDLSIERRHNIDHNVKLGLKRSRSQISFGSNGSSKYGSSKYISSQSYEFPSNTADFIQRNDTKLQLKSYTKQLIPTPKTSSRSCIPVLKSRLEAARKTENVTRSRSPARSPLTMTMLWRDNLSSKSHYATEESLKVEGTLKVNNQHLKEINNCIKNPDDIPSSCAIDNTIANTDSNITAQEQMVIYVNIFTKYDHNTTKIVDPNKFLEYIKNREMNIQKETFDNKFDKKNENLATDSIEKKQSAMHKIVTIVSSVINGNELNQNISTDLTASKANSASLTNSLSSDKLKHLCFLSVEQKEIDVTAKPSVTDTSTSITDLENISRTSESALNKFQICGTPKELNNDEYVALLEILHQEPNLAHLHELQNVCKKLVSERQISN